MLLHQDLLREGNLDFAINKHTYFEKATMSELHYHKHYELLYITQSDRKLIINNKEYTLCSSNIALIPPYIPHRTLSGKTIPQERILINFRENFIHSINKAFDFNIISCFSSEAPVIDVTKIRHELNAVITKLLYYAQSEDRYSKSHILLKFTELLTLICEISPPCSADSSFHEIIRFIEENFQEKITLDDLAQKFYINKYTILRNIKKYTGMGLPQYLNTIRIINAKKCIMGGMKIVDVALNCGFGSVSNFDRVFLAYEGISPRAYKSYLME